MHGLGEPVDVAVDTSSNVYVVGSATSNAFKITPGGVITQIIDSSRTEGGFAEPVAVATAGTDVYVLGGASSRRAFKITPTVITEIIGPGGDGVHPFELPGDIATDNLGKVYVSDRANRVFQISQPELLVLDYRRLCGSLEVLDLRIERALERRPRGAALDVGGEARVARDDVGVLQDAQDGRHHQIAGGEAVAVEIRPVAEPLGEGGEALLHELHGSRTAQLRPFLVARRRGRSPRHS